MQNDGASLFLAEDLMATQVGAAPKCGINAVQQCVWGFGSGIHGGPLSKIPDGAGAPSR